MRLIDADELIEEMKDNCCGECDLCIYSRYEGGINVRYFCGLIEEAETAERPKGERQSIFVVSVREEIDGEDVVYHRYFSSERKAETFINDNLKGQIVMSLSKEEVT